MFYQIRSYLSFLSQSTTKYGVHSPFVFDLITKCFNADSNKKKNRILKQYRLLLEQDTTQIEVRDFGAGSHVLKSNKSSIANIAKNTGITTKKAMLLMRITTYFKANTILEIGTSLGISTLALALGNEKARITTLEGCLETIKIPKKRLQEYVNTEIDFIVGKFDKTLPKVFDGQQYDIIYFDGDHKKNQLSHILKTV